ncbi:MAG: hypothetical protein J0H23_11680 [Micrococcales bacterium]|nr:hypothetical protein [Micrococcales bacterium]OJX69385.1 MAG: hypothetical protein BGO94_12750 [Micrococcales bacterium 72-143]
MERPDDSEPEAEDSDPQAGHDEPPRTLGGSNLGFTIGHGGGFFPALGPTPSWLGSGAFTVPGVNILGALTNQVTSIFRPFIDQQLGHISAMIIDPILEQQRGRWAEIFERLLPTLGAALPENWHDTNLPDLPLLERLLLDEGLALAWVPPSRILNRLLTADTAQERRRVIGQNWRTIARACIYELDHVTSRQGRQHADFIRRAAAALEDGHQEAAQALATNLLDSMVRIHFDKPSTVVGQNTRLAIVDLPLKDALVLGGIWGAFGEFRADRGDTVPRWFTRHASVHGVSRRQYSRVNAVIVLMHCTALLRLLELEVLTD